MAAIHFRSATDLIRDLRAGALGARELLEHHLARVDRLNPAINAVVLEDRVNARRLADLVDASRCRGETLGPLHGLPITVKESFDVVGLPTTWGFPRFRDHRAKADAVAVQRLRAAGAIVFGKTNVPIGLQDLQTYNDIYGTTNNPWDPSCGPGGSSGGSAAALAAGLTGLELGSDIAGSIRNPAHFCGVFGHKPTYGLLPIRGHGLDSATSPPDLWVIGPLARSAFDLELGLRVLAGPDQIEANAVQISLPPLDRRLSELRVAIWRDDALCPVSSAVRSAVDTVASKLASRGADIDDQARPAFLADQHHEIFRSLMMPEFMRNISDAEFEVLRAQSSKLDSTDQSVMARVLRHQTPLHHSWFQFDEARARIRWTWHEFFQTHDLLITPIASRSAFPHDRQPFAHRVLDVDGQSVPYRTQVFWAGLASVGGLPSTVIPVCRDSTGLPVGVQIIGRHYGDLQTIQVAQQLELMGCEFSEPPALENRKS